MLVSIGSAKGSPGATTVALALAAAWPDEAAILVEADVSGGDLTFRCRHETGGELAVTPSLTSLAAATRGATKHSWGGGLLHEHSQRLACGVRIVPGLLGPSQAGALEHLWPNLATVAIAAEEPVIADVGRIGGSTSADAFLDRSDIAVIVCQPTLDSLVHTRSLLASLSDRAGRRDQVLVVPLVVCQARHAAAATADVNEICSEIPGVEPSLAVAFDPSSAEQLARGANPRGRLAGSRLLRSVSTLWERIEAHRLDRTLTHPRVKAG
jgi:MinD-like ATPase involved in chromosome partitioning or flagellar assembly